MVHPSVQVLACSISDIPHTSQASYARGSHGDPSRPLHQAWARVAAAAARHASQVLWRQRAASGVSPGSSCFTLPPHNSPNQGTCSAGRLKEGLLTRLPVYLRHLGKGEWWAGGRVVRSVSPRLGHPPGRCIRDSGPSTLGMLTLHRAAAALQLGRQAGNHACILPVYAVCAHFSTASRLERRTVCKRSFQGAACSLL